jgi:hypothetical protein
MVGDARQWLLQGNRDTGSPLNMMRAGLEKVSSEICENGFRNLLNFCSIEKLNVFADAERKPRPRIIFRKPCDSREIPN